RVRQYREGRVQLSPTGQGGGQKSSHRASRSRRRSCRNSPFCHFAPQTSSDTTRRTLIVSDGQQNTPAAHSSGRSCVQLVNLPISRIWLHVLSWCRYQASIWGIPNYTREEMNIRDLQEQMGEMERGS